MNRLICYHVHHKDFPPFKMLSGGTCGKRLDRRHLKEPTLAVRSTEVRLIYRSGGAPMTKVVLSVLSLTPLSTLL